MLRSSPREIPTAILGYRLVWHARSKSLGPGGGTRRQIHKEKKEEKKRKKKKRKKNKKK
jgi:hypothetical protein